MKFTEVQVKFLGDFKVGDNIEYNANVLCELIKNNNAIIFNKIILIQTASIMKACIMEIIYRVQKFTREDMPNIEKNDIEEIRKNLSRNLIMLSVYRKTIFVQYTRVCMKDCTK